MVETYQTIVQLIGDLGAIGFVLFLTHRLTTKTIPDLSKEFQDSAAKQRAEFSATLNRQREDFVKWHEREIDTHEKHVSSIVDALKELTKEVRSGKANELRH